MIKLQKKEGEGRKKMRLKHLVSVLFVLAGLLVLAVPVSSDPGCGMAEVVEVHPGSGADVTDFFEVETAGDFGPVKRVEWGGTGYDFDLAVTVNGVHVPFGDGMNAYSGIHIPGMDLPFGGPLRKIKVICEDGTVAIDFGYGTGSGVVYADKKSGYKGSGWVLTPEMPENKYGLEDYATPGRETEKPTVVTLTSFKSSVHSKKGAMSFIGLVLAVTVVGLFVFCLHRRR